MSFKSIGLSDELHSYLVAHNGPADPLVADLVTETRASFPGNANFQIAPEQGPLLTFLTRLLGVRSALQDQRDELGGARADRDRVSTDALDRPLGISPVCARHVLGDRRVAAAETAAQVHRDALAPAEQLDRALGDAGIELLADQPMRHRVVMPVDVDVVVEPYPPHPPLGILIGLGR